MAIALLASLSSGAFGGPAPAATGKRLYREGLLGSGRPVEAVVEGDVAVTGAQVSCAACHGRSGMGSVEGRKLPSPLNRPFLRAPRALKSRPRPAYTDGSLARAIRDGIDAGGNRLGPLMPRYRLGSSDMAALVAYLKTLPSRPDPGASPESLQFAIVIAPGVDAAAREATLAVAQTFFRNKTAAARDRRGRHAPSWPEYFGDWVLQIWELGDAPATWSAQLEPPAGNGYYSLYFSQGAVLEARVIAAHLGRRPQPQRVLQVFREDAGVAARAVSTLAEALRLQGRSTSVEWRLTSAGPPAAEAIQQKARDAGATAVMLWLPAGDLSALGPGFQAGGPLYLSSTMLGGGLSAASRLGGPDRFAVHPYALPAEASQRFSRVAAWLKSQGIAASANLSRRAADQTFFAMTVLSEGVAHLKKNFYRDYPIELIDHFSGLESWSAFFPRHSFGPGQTYLSKGCYLVPLDGGGTAPEWIVP